MTEEQAKPHLPCSAVTCTCTPGEQRRFILMHLIGGMETAMEFAGVGQGENFPSIKKSHSVDDCECLLLAG